MNQKARLALSLLEDELELINKEEQGKADQGVALDDNNGINLMNGRVRLYGN